MNILNQPFDGQLGDILIEKMSENYSRLMIFSAFAKNSGVLRLKPAIEQFKQNGGYVEAFIGVDAHGTSYEALLNLFELCDDLYVIHSESSTMTFHSKVYMLTNNEDCVWISVGSNNLTGGGLWSNFESAVYFDATADDDSTVSINSLVEQYKDDEYPCSKHIESEEDLQALLNSDYIRREIRIHIENRTTRRNYRQNQELQVMFGTQAGVRIPQMPHNTIPTIIQNTQRNEQVRAIQNITETDVTERMWFETRALTGGSRNILDLSKLGVPVQGSGVGTRYETDKNNIVLGSIAFFDIQPDNTAVKKNITINYEGVDYHSCTIKFAPNNGSWRLQLKGVSAADEKIHLIEGRDWLRYKVIILEKIRTDYYVMSVLDNDQIDILKSQSIFAATNGSTANSKQYGLL